MLENGEMIGLSDSPRPAAAFSGPRPPSIVRPVDFSVYFRSSSPPLPAPHAWQQSVWIGPGREGVAEVSTHDPSAKWIERFPLYDSHLDWLYQSLQAHGVFDGEWRSRRDVPVGGGAEELTVVANGRTAGVPAVVAPEREPAARAMIAAVRALVPASVQNRLNDQRAQYVANFNRSAPPRVVPVPQHSNAYQAPVPVVAWLIPFGILAGGAFLAGSRGDSQAWPVLAVGSLTLGALAILAAPLDEGRGERYPEARRVTVRALLATMILFSVCCVLIAVNGVDGTLGIWPGMVFLPVWMGVALLWPLWTDSAAVRQDCPSSGWGRIGGFRMYYADANEDALWVNTGWVSVRTLNYFPNIGHRWGRTVMIATGVLIVAMIGLAVTGALNH